MNVIEIKENKKEYLSLLLLADEQEEMIDKYLERGTMYVLEENGVKAECVITDEGNSILEIKNLAVKPALQRQGWGRKLIEFIKNKYKDTYDILQVGTGESPLTIPFYESCGFRYAYAIKNFFIDNYDHPIYETGTMLKDMIILQQKLK